jgi:hypothetical protein
METVTLPLAVLFLIIVMVATAALLYGRATASRRIERPPVPRVQAAATVHDERCEQEGGDAYCGCWVRMLRREAKQEKP